MSLYRIVFKVEKALHPRGIPWGDGYSIIEAPDGQQALDRWMRLAAAVPLSPSSFGKEFFIFPFPSDTPAGSAFDPADPRLVPLQDGQFKMLFEPERKVK